MIVVGTNKDSLAAWSAHLLGETDMMDSGVVIQILRLQVLIDSQIRKVWIIKKGLLKEMYHFDMRMPIQ